MEELRQKLKIDLKQSSEQIIEFIQKILRNAGMEKVIVGMSGGVDSGLTAALCTKALGPENVIGIMLPLSFTPDEDTEHAVKQAEQLGIEYQKVPIDSITQSFFQTLNTDLDNPDLRIAISNIRARTRMIILYYFANIRNALVAGTGDKSEDLIGFFTKYGDGGVDFLPISHLYKTQVREMAEYLGVPEEIAQKPASPQLYPGHQATDEIPLEYPEMDPVLVGLFDEGMSPDEVSQITGVKQETVELIQNKINNSAHKRKYPPSLAEW